MTPPPPDIPGVRRIDLQRHDLSAPGREVIQNRVEISPEAPATRHFHPGEEVIYVLEGTIKYEIDGESAQMVQVGEVLTVPAERIHSAKNIGTGSCPPRRGRSWRSRGRPTGSSSHSAPRRGSISGRPTARPGRSS